MTTVLVTGPESSGNRMLCRILTEAGAAVLHKPMPMSTHWQPGMPGGREAWDGAWTDLVALEWDVAAIITRDPWCTIEAQVGAGHVRDEAQAVRRTRQSLIEIYRQLATTSRPWWPITYESLSRPEAVTELCLRLGLDGGRVETRWQDANSKYYGGDEWSDRRPLHTHPRLGL